MFPVFESSLPAYSSMDMDSIIHSCTILLERFTMITMKELIKIIYSSKRHSLQAVELSQRTQAAVQIVSNLPAPSNGGPIYRFLGMPTMRTRWVAGAAAHKSG